MARGYIISQVMAEYLEDFISLVNEEVSHIWIYSIDSSSNLNGCGVGVVFEGPCNILIEQSSRFKFRANNNQF